MPKGQKGKIGGAALGVMALLGFSLAANSEFILPHAAKVVSGFSGEALTQSARDGDALHAWGARRRAMDILLSCSLTPERYDLQKGPSVEQWRQQALCVVVAMPRSSDERKQEFEKESRALALGDAGAMAAAVNAYSESGVYDSGVGAMIAFEALSGWQAKAIMEGLEPPKESLELAQEGLSKARAGIRLELTRAKERDAGLFIFDPKRRSAAVTRMTGIRALQSYWMTMKPEARESALKAHVAQGHEGEEPTEYMRMREEALRWAEEEMAAIEKSISPASGSWGWLDW